MTLNEFMEQWQSASPTLPVHTSGSTGKPKLLLVEKERDISKDDLPFSEA